MGAQVPIRAAFTPIHQIPVSKTSPMAKEEIVAVQQKARQCFKEMVRIQKRLAHDPDLRHLRVNPSEFSGGEKIFYIEPLKLQVKEVISDKGYTLILRSLANGNVVQYWNGPKPDDGRLLKTTETGGPPRVETIKLRNATPLWQPHGAR